MEIITKTDMIRDAAKNWKNRFFSKRTLTWNNPPFVNDDSEQIFIRLLRARTEAEIDKAIGEPGWAELKCDECGKEVNLVILMSNQDIGHETTLQFCPVCLQKAVTMAKQNE